MALSNSEYNFIMREYEERRYAAKWDLDKRTKEVYENVPRIKEIHDEISTIAVENVKNRILGGVGNGKNSTKEELHEQIKKLTAEKDRLLKENGYSLDYLKEKYVCEDCKDTGYIENEKCHCLKEKIAEILYSKSNLREILNRENFTKFNFDLYEEDFKDTVTNESAKTNIYKAVKVAKDFVDNFGKEAQNLLIYGHTGVGKTFLTNCIAKEIMDKSKSVIYLSSIRLFEMLAEEQFDKKNKESFTGLKDILECDLLIIDDLGTELVNNFTMSAFFNCINERFLKRKSVIISTNLSVGQIKDIYSERIFSRLVSNYTLLKIFGKDLRIVTSLGLTKP